MARITEDLIRKRAEHNECIIATLEEISLHQQDLERIEHLDKWCRELKILYLQSNLIPKIENVGRLKKLEYINLALNNVERIENLEGCESLNKLDLTVNFVGELTSVESLRKLVHLRELYLTGNPCTEFVGYREFVIASLPQLQSLDGIAIEKSERIFAVQALAQNRGVILQQQVTYRRKRAIEKAEAEAGQKKTTKDDRWYTDINSDRCEVLSDDEEEEEIVEKTEEERDKEFWEEKTAYTPESRVRVHEYMEEKRKREEFKEKSSEPAPRIVRLETEDGRKLNINEAKVDFDIWDDDAKNAIILDVALFRHMDTGLCDVDVQPDHVKVTVKGKVLQLVLEEEVNPDSSKAERSQTTGHLLVTMPKVKEVVRAMNQKENVKPAEDEKPRNPSTGHERLEVDPSLGKIVNLNVVQQNEEKLHPKIPFLGATITDTKNIPERENSENFEDDPDVPPLM